MEPGLKKIAPLFFIIIILSQLSSFAQPTLWKRLPLEFNAAPYVIYYDSIEEVSYIAGSFSIIGNDTCDVVKWDGMNYTFLPSSSLNGIGIIRRFKDKIYAGSGNGLASWNGTAWTRLDTAGIDISVGDLYVHEGKLYVAGLLEHIVDSEESNIVGVWNDTTWSSLLSIDTVGMLTMGARSIVNYKGNFYVAGGFGFYENGNFTCRLIMHDGTRWKGVIGNGGITNCGNSWVEKLMVWNDTLYVTGKMGEQYGNPGNGIAQWDGQQWHRMSNGLLDRNDISLVDDDATVTDIMVINGEIYTCGYFNNVDGIYHQVSPEDPYNRGLAKWTGNQWCTLNTIADNTIIRMGRFKDTMFITGNIRVVNGDSINYIAKWIGGTYTDSCAQPATTDLFEIDPGISKNGVSIYPNPNRGQFYVKFDPEQNPTAKLYLFDLTGRMLHFFPLQQQEEYIETGNLPAGIYLAKIITETGVTNIKLTIGQ